MHTEILLYLALGLFAGFSGGLLGIGGGIIFLPVLRLLAGLPPTIATGTCVVGSLATAISGSAKHYKFGNIQIKNLWPIVIAGAISSSVSSLFFIHLAQKKAIFDLVAGTIIAAVSIRMIWGGYKNKEPSEGTQSRLNSKTISSLIIKIIIGLIAGAIPAFIGLGAGVFLVPALTFFLNVPIKRAIGTSLACFLINALVSASFKFSQGYVELEIALPICLGALIGAHFGAIASKKVPSRHIKLLFGILTAFVAIKFIFASIGNFN